MGRRCRTAVTVAGRTKPPNATDPNDAQQIRANPTVLAEFYGLTQDPFRLNPDPRFCFRHRNFAKAKAYMQYVLHQGEGFVMVTGQPGTGKTMLIEDLLADRSAEKVKRAHITSTQVGADDLLRLVASAFGIESRNSSKSTILLNLRAVLLQQIQSGHNSLVIVDEAQNLPYESIEELRMITNLQEGARPLLQVFLVGQDSLRALVGQPRMEQLRQRILAACRMEPLGPEETQGYLQYRLSRAGWSGRPSLSGEAVWLLHEATGGVPRLINSFAGRLLLHGAVEEKPSLGADDARLVIQELEGELTLASGGDEGIARLAGIRSDLPSDVRSLAVEMPASGKAGTDSASQDQLAAPAVVGTAESADSVERPAAAAALPEAEGQAADERSQAGNDTPAELCVSAPGPAKAPPIPVAVRDDQEPPASIFVESTAAPIPEPRVDTDHPQTGAAAGDSQTPRPEDVPPGPPVEAVPTAAADGVKTARRYGVWLGATAVIAVSFLGLVALKPQWLEAAGERLQPVVHSIESLATAARTGAERLVRSFKTAPRAPQGSPVSLGSPPESSGEAPGKSELGAVAQKPIKSGSPATIAPAPEPAPPTRTPVSAAPSAKPAPSTDAEQPESVPRSIPAVNPQPGDLVPHAGTPEIAEGPAASGPAPQLPTASAQRRAELTTPGASMPAEPEQVDAPAPSEVQSGDLGADMQSPPRQTEEGTPPQQTGPASLEIDKAPSARRPLDVSPGLGAGSRGLSALAERLRSLGLQPQRADDGAVKVNLKENVSFGSDSALVPPDSRAFVERLARELALSSDTTVKVVGHTDDSGPEDYNAQLSLRRAKAVAALLVAGGVPASEVASEGRGESDPLTRVDVDGVPARQINRRIELIVRSAKTR